MTDQPEIADFDDLEIDLPEVDQEQNGNNNAKKVTTFTGSNCSNFKDFLLKKELNRAIQDCGFEHPSEVQQECIPQTMIGRDVLCQAVSGMGKTAVFIISILHRISDEPKPNTALIMCNTRELAYQIKKETDRFTKYLPKIRSEVFFGGIPIQDNVAILDGPNPPHIVIGTPGRILQLCRQKTLKLDNLEYFVLDECDKMLVEPDMRSQVQKIFLSGNAENRQVMMFSATLSDKAKEVCSMYMKDPYKLFIDQDSKLTLHGLTQYFVKLEENKKIMKLVQLLDKLEFNQVMIFTSEQKYAQKLCEVIKKEGFPAEACFSSMPQEKRIEVYNRFKNNAFRIMVTTDVFGRGIDIEKVNVVINFDMPHESDQYLHRVGRAGRFGTKGIAISFISSQKEIDVLQEVQDRFEVKVEEMPASIDKSLYMNN